MSSFPIPAVVALAVLAIIVVASFFGVKLRAAARRGGDVKVYDFGADLTLPRPLPDRSYKIALYLTLKSLPRESGVRDL